MSVKTRTERKYFLVQLAGMSFEPVPSAIRCFRPNPRWQLIPFQQSSTSEKRQNSRLNELYAFTIVEESWRVIEKPLTARSVDFPSQLRSRHFQDSLIKSTDSPHDKAIYRVTQTSTWRTVHFNYRVQVTYEKHMHTFFSRGETQWYESSKFARLLKSTRRDAACSNFPMTR